MKILLINPPTENTIESCMPKILEEDLEYLPPLGLMSIAGYLQKNTTYDIEILDCQVDRISFEKLEEILKNKKINFIGVTTMTFTLIDVIKTAKIAKKINPNVKIILGGPHVNIYQEETMEIPEIDYLILGEGEETIKQVIENYNNVEQLKNIKGLVFRDQSKIINTGQKLLYENLDFLPFPARKLTPYKKYSSILAKKNLVTTMFTSRGCPYNCLFCDRPHLGKKFRARSAINVVKEFEECKKLGIEEVFIYDDTFTIDQQRVIDICRGIIDKKLNIYWDVRARVNTVDYELLKLMKKAGCLRIHYGVEAGTNKILKVLRKGITLEMVEKVFRATKKAGIQTVAYFMIGSPEETLEDIKSTMRFAKKINPDFIHVSITTPFPATDLYYLGLQKGLIKNDYWREFAKNPQNDFVPPPWEENFTKDELIELLKGFYRSFYLRPLYLFKKVVQLKSFGELFKKAKGAFRMLRI